MEKFISYYRVSSRRQGDSGLGLEAQKQSVADFMAASRERKLLGEYREVESAARHSLDNRPQLAAAVSHALRVGAVLLVAKIDRLYRSTVVRSILKQQGVRFIACDFPQANDFTLDILAAVAEHESQLISTRTRAALAALRRRDKKVRLGAHRRGAAHLTLSARRKGAQVAGEVHHAKAVARYKGTFPAIIEMRRAGKSLAHIAHHLNELESSDDWHPTKVYRALRYAQLG